jgi:hypothetical protein
MGLIEQETIFFDDLLCGFALFGPSTDCIVLLDKDFKKFLFQDLASHKASAGYVFKEPFWKDVILMGSSISQVVSSRQMG